MADDSKPDNDAEQSSDLQQDAPSDALSRTPDDLEEEAASRPESATEKTDDPTEKKVSPIKRLFRKLNVYFLLFGIIVVIAAVITVVNYLNSQQAPPGADIEAQNLTQEELAKLANTDASVGSSNQTLTIKGDTIIEGQSLMRGNLNVAGNFQAAGTITGPNLTVSGNANLGTTQVNTLQVAQNLSAQGATTMRDLTVSGAASFGGAVTVQQLTVTRLTLGGNAQLEIPNHLRFSGPSPNRASINSGVLGNGGSSSVEGSDTSGTVNISTGNNPTAGCFTRIDFNQTFTTTPRIIISPVGAGAGSTTYYVTKDNSGFSICASTPAPANQAFSYDYFIAG